MRPVRWWKSRIRMVEWKSRGGRTSYVRLFPNAGFDLHFGIVHFHLCKKHGFTTKEFE